MVSCDTVSNRFCGYSVESILGHRPKSALQGDIIGDLCPQSCDLCNEQCDLTTPMQPHAPTRSPQISGPGRPFNNSCVVNHWIDALRTSTDLPLTRGALAQSLLRVLEDASLETTSCSSNALQCHPGKDRLQTWRLEPLRPAVLQSCAEQAPRKPEAPTLITFSAQEHAQSALAPSTDERIRRTLRRAGLAVLVSALDRDIATAARTSILDAAPVLRHAPVYEASHREHVLLDPSNYAAARILTALGVRADSDGRRRGVLSGVVPEGASLTELASIIVYPGASAQALHTDTEVHTGDATMTTAFIVLQDTPPKLGALAVVPGSHTTGCRDDPFDSEPGRPQGSTLLDAPAGSIVLMDSRLLHGGGAHTAPPPRGSTDGEAPARVVFYFSWVNQRVASTPYLPLGSTFALNGELWGKVSVPVQPTQPLPAPPRPSSNGHEAAGDAWTIVDLITARLEVCTAEDVDWNANVALRCLGPYGSANAAFRYVHDRAREYARMGTAVDARCEI